MDKVDENTFQSIETTIAYVMPDSVVNYLNAALDTMERHSIKKNEIDWQTFRSNIIKKAAGSTTYSQTYPVLEFALKNLGDNHSFFKKPEQVVEWNKKSVIPGRKKWQPPIAVMRDEIAEIRLSSYSSGNTSDNIKHAQDLQNAIQGLDSLNPKGWIIDLSHNSGGNIWPMLAGIGPLVIEGIQGSFYSVDQKKIPWYYKTGEVGISDSVILKLPKPYSLKNKNAPIAIFISGLTASSGEAILISFKNRRNVRIFGEPTAGLATANASFYLKDGAQLIITSAIFMDSNDKLYGGQIMPDVDLSELWYYVSGFEHYIMLQEAEKWFETF